MSARALSLVGRAAAPRPDVRAFCGDAFPWALVRELADGADVVACYLVHEKQRKETKAGKPFLHLVLGDRTGTIEAKVWDGAERLDPLFAADDVVGVRGRTGTYNGKLELTVAAVQPLEAGEDDLAFFIPASPRDREAMGRELDQLVASVQDRALRTLLERMTGRRTDTGRKYRVHPAAKRNHHAYLGGLLEHSLSVAKAADRLAAHYAAQGARLDRDLLVTAALLHDVGKVREIRMERTFRYTDEGHLLGHILLGLQMVVEEAATLPALPPERLLHLQHLIASHQGRLEWASPKVPQTLEALLLHYADDLDSKMNPAMALVEATGPGEFSGYDRALERSLYHPPALRGAPASDVEPVEPGEIRDVMFDLFRG